MVVVKAGNRNLLPFLVYTSQPPCSLLLIFCLMDEKETIISGPVYETVDGVEYEEYVSKITQDKLKGYFCFHISPIFPLFKTLFLPNLKQSVRNTPPHQSPDNPLFSNQSYRHERSLCVPCS